MTTPIIIPANVPAALNVAAALAAAGFDPSTIAQALLDPTVYPTLTATELARILHDQRVAPAITRADLSAALTSTNRYQAAQVTAALDAIFPPPPVTPATSNTAFALSGGGYLTAGANPAYSFGVGDFTVEAAVHSTAPGTVLGRKGTAGGAGNGGFLLVIKAGGVVKFATDSGSGFFECTAPSPLLDGQWHHIAAVRAGAGISLFIDGQPATATPAGNAKPPLDVGNGLRLTIGTVDQAQEPFRALTGELAEVRLWRGARTPDQIRQAMWSRLPFDAPNLVGRWSGEFGAAVDLSPTRNITTPSGAVATAAGPPASNPGSVATPYVGAYDTATRTAPDAAWTAGGPLYVFPTGVVVWSGRVLPGATVSPSSMSWPADPTVGAGSVTFAPSGQDPTYWSGVAPGGPVLQGTHQPPGAARHDLRGQRRP
jgi:hypothetical protein